MCLQERPSRTDELSPPWGLTGREQTSGALLLHFCYFL